MEKIKVLIGPSTFAEIDKSPIIRLIDTGFEIVENPYKRKLTKEELLVLLSDVSGLIAGLEVLDREVLGKSQLKVISRCGSGLSNIDLKAAKDLGIFVKSTPLAPVTAVAELTIGCLLTLLRQVPQMNEALHKRKWSKRIGRQLCGMNIAIVGFGNIGKRVGQLLLALGAKVFAVDPLYLDKIDFIHKVDFDEALRKADVITLHCSGENCILGEREFKLMKRGGYILNAARGSLIDELALKQALDDNHVAGVWFDTFQNEPYSGILCEYNQVILTPHIGSYTFECRRDMEMESVENLINTFNVKEA